MKVLIVDDNEKVRLLLRDHLPPAADEIYECADGDEAFALFEKHWPDWVLMDQDMPRMDGITATREIIASFPKANICMVTAFDEEELRDEAFAAGACGFVAKSNLFELETMLVNDLKGDTMNPINARKRSISTFTLVLSLFVLLFVHATANAQSPTPEETNCFNLVQNKVAWDRAGSTSWSEANVRNLCKGTTNAGATVNCFKSKISSGVLWDKATAACSPSELAAPTTPAPTTPAPTITMVSQPLPSKIPYNYSEERCVNMIQDKVMYDGNTFAKHWDDQNLANLCRGPCGP